MDEDSPAVAELTADVAVAVSRRITAVSGDVYEVILREIPELRDDKPVLTLLASSVHGNIGTCLQALQHQIDLGTVRAPAAALEYARRLAQSREGHGRDSVHHRMCKLSQPCPEGQRPGRPG